MPASSWLMNLDFAGSVASAPAPAPAPTPSPSQEFGGGGAAGGSGWKIHERKRQKLLKDDEEILELAKQAFLDIINKYYR